MREKNHGKNYIQLLLLQENVPNILSGHSGENVEYGHFKREKKRNTDKNTISKNVYLEKKL